MFVIIFTLAKATVQVEARSRRHSNNTALKFIRVTSICFYVRENIELDVKQKAYMKFTSRTLFCRQRDMQHVENRIKIELL